MGKNTHLKVINLKEFNAALDHIKIDDETGKRMVEAGARVIETQAKINIEQNFSGKSTGGLANSITVNINSVGGKTEAEIGPTKIYGRIQELGGIIKPVTARMLHWVEDGIDIFANIVHIPARPYLRPAVDEHIPEITQAVGNVLAARMGKL